MIAMNSIILKVGECYMAVLDAASPVNVHGLMMADQSGSMGKQSAMN